MSDSSWQAYGLIVHFSQRLSDQRSLGKTKLQKLVYLLEKLKNVSVGYEFCFYTYGPFSSDLAADLDYINTLGGVKINYAAGINMYEIIPGDNAARLTKKSEDFLATNEAAIDEIIDRFGSHQAKELELLATLVFVSKSGITNESEIIQKVKALKPKFDIEEITEYLQELQGWGYVN